MKVTMTVDTDRLAQFGGGEESILDFVTRVASEARGGRRVVWTTTAANVGTIDRIETSRAAEVES